MGKRFIYTKFMPMNKLNKALSTYRYQVRDVILWFFKPRQPADIGKKVSVLIPTLGKGKQSDHLLKLKKLLSVYFPNQSHKNYELLVYCDGPNKDVDKMVASLGDSRIKVYSTESTMGKWGHPQTRMGINYMTGDFFVRVNDDNKPYKDYLRVLINGFEQETGIVYGRIIFKGEARKRHLRSLSNSFIIPGDKEGALKEKNIDCMNFMVRLNLAKEYVSSWNDDFAADWFFLEAMLKDGIKAKFIDTIIGEKF